MDRILLNGIRFFGYHGAYAEERRLGQHFLADVELYLDLREAGDSDDLARGVDYSRVLARVLEIGAGEPVQLLEALASRIASSLLEQFPIRRVVVRVTKPAPPLPGLGGGVTVEIARP
ncbi:MAG: dihydroneopterin aldolase [Candidatus Methylomirabilota bacterium]